MIYCVQRSSGRLWKIYVKHSTASATHILVDYYSYISLCQTMICWPWNPKDGPLISVGWNSSLISPVLWLQMWTFFLLMWFSFQAILVLVHDLGPNWELVSDVLSSNSQLKVMFMSFVHSCYWKSSHVCFLWLVCSRWGYSNNAMVAKVNHIWLWIGTNRQGNGVDTKCSGLKEL